MPRVRFIWRSVDSFQPSDQPTLHSAELFHTPLNLDREKRVTHPRQTPSKISTRDHTGFFLSIFLALWWAFKPTSRFWFLKIYVPFWKKKIRKLWRHMRAKFITFTRFISIQHVVNCRDWILNAVFIDKCIWRTFAENTIIFTYLMYRWFRHIFRDFTNGLEIFLL